ncbi:MAG: acyl carrier protein [Actinomycetota bacterium]|nr:acyl carrier protein [Actinomycetota bacterium]
MSAATFTLDDLIRILREGAGADEQIDLSSDISDTSFSDLGYDSLALLETNSRIERELGITLADAVLFEAETPRDLLDVVNAELTTTTV